MNKYVLLLLKILIISSRSIRRIEVSHNTEDGYDMSNNTDNLMSYLLWSASR